MSPTRQADVVIVGAGLGGMLSALLLAREGYRTIVLERLPYPGGRYTSLDDQGYSINTGAWAVGLHGTNGPLWKLLVELGVNVDVRVPQPVPAHLRLKDKDIPLPPKGQLRTIIDAVSRSEQEATRVMAAIRQGLFWQEPSDELTIEQWLHLYTDNPLIHSQFNYISRSTTGLDYDVFPAGEYFRLLRGFGQCGSLTAIARNGQKTTMDAMVARLEQMHALLELQTEVKHIACSRGKVEGVLAVGPDGEQLNVIAPVVISDVGPEETVKLASQSSFDPGFLQQVAKLAPTMAVVTVFGHDKPLLDCEGRIQFIETDRLATVWEPCQLWPEYAPPGRSCLYTYATMRTDDTDKELALIIEQCQERLPSLAGVEIIAQLLFKQQWPMLRARPARCLGIRTPVPGLYLAGDAVNVSGWTGGEGISFSSWAIAEDVKMRFSKDGF